MVKMFVPNAEQRQESQSTRRLVDSGEYDSLVNRVQLMQTTDPERIKRAEGEIYPYLRVTFRLVNEPKMVVHNFSTHPNFWATTEEFLMACGLDDDDIATLGDATEQDLNQLLINSRVLIQVGRRQFDGRWNNYVVGVLLPEGGDPALEHEPEAVEQQEAELTL